MKENIVRNFLDKFVAIELLSTTVFYRGILIRVDEDTALLEMGEDKRKVAIDLSSIKFIREVPTWKKK